MSAPEFFRGERAIGSFEHEYGPTFVQGTVKERWEKVIGLTVACGQEAKRRITKSLGISKEHRQELEGSAKATFGINFLTELKLAINAKTSSAITFDSSVIEENEFTFRAPDCFERRVDTYQLQYVVELECSYRPFIGKGKYWNMVLEVWRNEIHQTTSVEPRHVECGCPHGTEDTGSLVVKGGPFSMLEPYFRVDGVVQLYTVGVQAHGGHVTQVHGWQGRGDFNADEVAPIERAMPGLPFDYDPLRPLFERPHQLTYEAFPEYLRFLAGVDVREHTWVRFRDAADSEIGHAKAIPALAQ